VFEFSQWFALVGRWLVKRYIFVTVDGLSCVPGIYHAFTGHDFFFSINEFTRMAQGCRRLSIRRNDLNQVVHQVITILERLLELPRISADVNSTPPFPKNHKPHIQSQTVHS